jgi:hypothetical protein
VLAAIAGLCLGLMWRGTTPMVVLAGLALYLAAYDAVEPLAQEIDHPSRWDSFPDDSGRVLLMHLPVAIVVMLVACAITAATALTLVPGKVVGSLVFPIALVVASASAAGAAVSCTTGQPNVTGLIGLGDELMGVVLAARLLLPPAVTVVSLLPLLLAGHNPNAVQTARVGNAAVYPLFAVFGAGLWIRYRKPSHV